jgi:hypothetical protein
MSGLSLSRTVLLAFLGGVLSEIAVFGLWQLLGFSPWIAVVTFALVGVAWILVYLYYPRDRFARFPTLPNSELQPKFTVELSDSRKAALRGGYASILTHLYCFEHWADILKREWTSVGTREEFAADNPVSDKDFFGNPLPIKDYMKALDQRDERYNDKVGANKIMREVVLGIQKMKASIEPAFKIAFPDEIDEVTKMAKSYTKDATDLDESTGFVGVFETGAALARMTEESNRLYEETERLRKLFARDESVMILLNNLREEHKFLWQKVEKIRGSKKGRGLPF